MPKVTQVTVSCEDRPGSLARFARLLGNANSTSLLSWRPRGETGLEGFVRLVVDKPKKAKAALEKAGMRYTEQPVLHIELANTPGTLANFAEELADKDINITAAHEPSVRGAKFEFPTFVVIALAIFAVRATI